MVCRLKKHRLAERRCQSDQSSEYLAFLYSADVDYVSGWHSTVCEREHKDGEIGTQGTYKTEMTLPHPSVIDSRALPIISHRYLISQNCQF